MKDKAMSVASKKMSYIWLLAGVFYALSFCSYADDSSGLSLEGTVKDYTCTFVGTSVKLDTVMRREFAGKGSVLGVKSLNIGLKSCGAEVGKLKITVHGEVTTEDEYAFRNKSTGTGSASGVGLYFYQSDGSSRFRPDGTIIQNVTMLIPSADIILQFRAGYVALLENPVAGSFGAVVNIHLEYI